MGNANEQVTEYWLATCDLADLAFECCGNRLVSILPSTLALEHVNGQLALAMGEQS